MEFRDLKAQYDKYKSEIDSAIQEVINNTNFIVTSGISDWELKIKTGCKSEYVFININ